MTDSPSRQEPRPTITLVALTGFMGSGKSSVGRALAFSLGWTFVDLDAEIERRERQKIRDLFGSHGEERFRDMEAAALAFVLANAPRPLVLATGGGTFVQPRNAELLRAQGAQIVFLDAAVEILMGRCCNETDGALRPLAHDAEAFQQLHELRLPLYRTADLIVDSNTASPEQVAREIAVRLNLPPHSS